MVTNPQWIWLAVGVAAVLVIVGLIVAGSRRARTSALRDHFGKEYDRTVREAGSRTAAEDELAARAEEAKEFDIRPLTASEATQFRRQWQAIEQNFVGRPVTAVVEADEMITSIMRTVGYPIGDFEKYASLLSVKHPHVVEHYRAGHDAIDAHGRGTASTEDLRQAMLHYRALFAELVGSGGSDTVHEIPTVAEVDRPRTATPSTVRDEDRPIR